MPLPKDRQQGLVGQQHLPRRLYPQWTLARQRQVEQVRAELVRDEPLPRVELEQRPDLAILLVDEAAPRGVPADLLDRQADSVQTGLLRALLQVRDGHEVLADLVGEGVREVHRPAWKQ